MTTIDQIAERLHTSAEETSIGVVSNITELTPEVAGQVLVALDKRYGRRSSSVLRVHLREWARHRAV